MDPGLFWGSPPVPAADVYAAQHSADGPFLMVIATDVLGSHTGDSPTDYESLVTYGTEVLRYAHAKVISTERGRAFDVETAEVTGELGKVRLSIRLLYLGYRKFEFRCYHLIEQAECGSALSNFIIKDLPERRYVSAVLHLRDARFGVAFDAPDDSWLSRGPQFAMGGGQVVWTWGKSDREISIQAMDLEAMPSHPDQATFATMMADSARASGHRVVESQTAFAGQLWDHHEMSRKGSGAQDMFILVRQGVMYGVLVTQPTRDPRLLDAAKHGFRLIARSSSKSP